MLCGRVTRVVATAFDGSGRPGHIPVAGVDGRLFQNSKFDL